MRQARGLCVAIGTALVVLGAGSDLVRAGTALEVTTFARAVQPGEVIRLDVTCDCGGSSPVAVAFDTEIVLAPAAGGTRWQGLIGIDLDVTPGEYPLRVVAADGSERVHTGTLRVATKAFQTRQLRVAPAYVEPPADTVERILSEAARLEALWATVTPRLWQGPVTAPLSTRPSNNFGARSIFNGESRNPHGGIDYSSPTGTRVSAPAAGRVVIAEDLYFTGNTVILDHGLGLYSVLAHLSAITVAPNAVVDGGTVVGRVGATGRATGPHLHWGVRLNGARVDPLSLIAATK